MSDFTAIVQTVKNSEGITTAEAHCNMCLMLAGIGLDDVIRYVRFNLEFLTTQDQLTFVDGVMTSHYRGVASINF